VVICLERGENDLHMVQLMPLQFEYRVEKENSKECVAECDVVCIRNVTITNKADRKRLVDGTRRINMRQTVAMR